MWNSTNFDECPTRRTCDLVAFAIVSNSNQSFHNYILAGEICFKLYYLSLWIEFVYVYLMLFVLKILIFTTFLYQKFCKLLKCVMQAYDSLVDLCDL